MQVENQLARLVSLLDLKKATPKPAAPAAAEPEEQQPREEVQLEAGHDASAGGNDAQEKKAAGAHRQKKRSKQKLSAADS